MAFAAKVDYCGLLTAVKSGENAALLIRSSDKGGSNEKYQPQGQDGSFVLTEIYGEDSSPTNDYGLKLDVSLAAGDIKLNKVTTITTGEGSSAVSKYYALEKVSIKTAAGSPVSISASCQEIEDGATDATQNLYWIPALSLDRDQDAKFLFGAFTVTGSGCHLTACDAEIACSINKDKVAGVKISSDCNSGVITLTGTIISTRGTDPTVTPLATAVSLGNSQTSTWVMTKAPTISEKNPETVAKEYTFELQLPLVKAVTASNA